MAARAYGILEACEMSAPATLTHDAANFELIEVCVLVDTDMRKYMADSCQVNSVIAMEHKVAQVA